MMITNQNASDIATYANGRVEGDAKRLVTSIGKIDDGIEGSLCFLANPKYEQHLYDHSDMTVLVQEGFVSKKSCDNTLIYVSDVYTSFSDLLKKYKVDIELNNEIEKLSSVSQFAILDSNVHVGKFSVVSEQVRIGKDSRIMDQVFIGPRCTLGSNVLIHPGAKIYADSVIGNNVIIHANVVIGSDGFGFSPSSNGYDKIPQVGNVIIEDDVEIGSGTTIDRATIGSTIIKKGAKLDNLIMIGHNVIVEENAVIAAQSGVAGSSVIGKGSMLGGQVGVVGHIKIAPFSQIQAKSGIAASIKQKGKKWYGYPSLPYTQYLKSYSIFKMLPLLLKRIQKLEDEKK